MSHLFEQTVTAQQVKFCVVPETAVSQDQKTLAADGDTAQWLHHEMRVLFDTIDRMVVGGPSEDLLERLFASRRAIAVNASLVPCFGALEVVVPEGTPALPLSA
jgi:hypothetical protein